jgi:hypothetical protein
MISLNNFTRSTLLFSAIAKYQSNNISVTVNSRKISEVNEPIYVRPQ